MEKQSKERTHWIYLRKELNNKYADSVKWTSAVVLFDNRIQDKYFKPIGRLIAENQRKGEGFPIVTIQCALIETFAAFKEGLIYNHNKPGEGGLSYEYKESRELFVRFLNTEAIFQNIFYTLNKDGEKSENSPFSGTQFYSQVRCGLMHEARTKGDWHINATASDNPKDKKFIKQKAKGNIIYRTLFQNALSEYFKGYKLSLLSDEKTADNLRRLFARKLDHLYDLKDSFEWWEV